MGKLENKTAKKTRRTRTQEAVLTAIWTAGVLSIGLVVPNVIGAMNKLDILPHSRASEVIKSIASRLRKKGLVKFENGYYSLTSGGEKLLSYWQMSDFKLKKPARWDGKWRVIIFDIPEKKRWARDEVRRIFASAGICRLQDSVWVYPYDCEDVIGLLKTHLGIGKDLLYMIVDEIENDRHLRELFNLI